MKTKHSILHDHKDNYRTPMQIIEALDDARNEFVNSNYHTGLFEKAQQIIRAWATQEGIEIGLTAEQRAKAYEFDQAKFFDDLMKSLEKNGVPPDTILGLKKDFEGN